MLFAFFLFSSSEIVQSKNQTISFFVEIPEFQPTFSETIFYGFYAYSDRNGGIIYFYGYEFILTIIRCLLAKSGSKHYGGGIYALLKEFYFVQSCAFDLEGFFGIFCYVQDSNIAANGTVLIDTTIIAQCAPPLGSRKFELTEQFGSFVIIGEFYIGYVTISQVNQSRNYAIANSCGYSGGYAYSGFQSGSSRYTFQYNTYFSLFHSISYSYNDYGMIRFTHPHNADFKYANIIESTNSFGHTDNSILDMVYDKFDSINRTFLIDYVYFIKCTASHLVRIVDSTDYVSVFHFKIILF